MPHVPRPSSVVYSNQSCLSLSLSLSSLLDSSGDFARICRIEIRRFTNSSRPILEPSSNSIGNHKHINSNRKSYQHIAGIYLIWFFSPKNSIFKRRGNETKKPEIVGILPERKGRDGRWETGGGSGSGRKKRGEQISLSSKRIFGEYTD